MHERCACVAMPKQNTLACQFSHISSKPCKHQTPLCKRKLLFFLCYLQFQCLWMNPSTFCFHLTSPYPYIPVFLECECGFHSFSVIYLFFSRPIFFTIFSLFIAAYKSDPIPKPGSHIARNWTKSSFTFAIRIDRIFCCRYCIASEGGCNSNMSPESVECGLLFYPRIECMASKLTMASKLPRSKKLQALSCSLSVHLRRDLWEFCWTPLVALACTHIDSSAAHLLYNERRQSISSRLVTNATCALLNWLDFRRQWSNPFPHTHFLLSTCCPALLASGKYLGALLFRLEWGEMRMGMGSCRRYGAKVGAYGRQMPICRLAREKDPLKFAMCGRKH